MTEDTIPKAFNESEVASSAGRQRKKRKWDQPAESFVSAGIAIPSISLAVNSILGTTLPSAATLSGTLLTNPVSTNYISPLQLVQSPAAPQSAAAVSKLNQPKIQDELIAREIVINDAEPTIRYKLTKRQTQDEIQKCTGAVVITRGKYQPPNELPDSEKPLYLHISAGAHLKDIPDRIRAVDRAATMVEEILKQGSSPLISSIPPHSVLLNGQVTQIQSTCVFLGFDADSSLNIAARIRGPNDLYVNHIMNETGATVVLRGRGSERVDSSHIEEASQPLHLYLSSTNPKSLEAAKVFAENLLDTIATECGASRISSIKVYGAVPPPQQLSEGTESSSRVLSTVSGNQVAVIPSAAAGLMAATESICPGGISTSIGSIFCTQGTVVQPGDFLKHGSPQSSVSYPLPAVPRATCYDGYEGIYPQATPLQQVALALRQASASSTSSLVSTTERKFGSNAEAARPPLKRKFKELPVTPKVSTALQNSQQGSEFLKPGPEDSGASAVLSIPPPRKLVDTGSSGIPPPPPRNMPPPPPKFSTSNPAPSIEHPNKIFQESSVLPVCLRSIPPPPKFSEPVKSPKKNHSGSVDTKKSSVQHLSDTLLKLAEYGDEDDEEISERSVEMPKGNPTTNSTPKPFWAV